MSALLLVSFLLSLVSVIPACADAGSGRSWRLALAVGGEYPEFKLALRGIARELERQGLIENASIPLQDESVTLRAMWTWLADNAGGRVHFVPDAFYSSNWIEEKRLKSQEALVRRLEQQGDIDLILAMGTWAGQDLATDAIATPVVLCATSNAVGAGIVPSREDSGRDNFFAVVDENRTRRQVTLFHSIFQFTKLGVVHEDSPSGRSSVNMDEIERTASFLNVELVTCKTAPAANREDHDYHQLLRCHQYLADQEVEAVYITFNRGMATNKMPAVLAPFVKAHIPTFSQLGSTEVEKGVLLGMSKAAVLEEGQFAGVAVASILRGAMPRTLAQCYEGPVTLAVNLRMTTLIGWNPPLEVLAVVDEFFQKM